jgi:hypothetical protein
MKVTPDQKRGFIRQSPFKAVEREQKFFVRHSSQWKRRNL